MFSGAGWGRLTQAAHHSMMSLTLQLIGSYLVRSITSLIGHSDSVQSLAFTSGGKTLISSSYDGSAILWNLDYESWRELACNIVNRNLTQEEWEVYLPNEPYRETCSNILLTKPNVD